MTRRALHAALTQVLAEHKWTGTTCTCGHWQRLSFDEHLLEAVVTRAAQVMGVTV